MRIPSVCKRSNIVHLLLQFMEGSLMFAFEGNADVYTQLLHRLNKVHTGTAGWWLGFDVEIMQTCRVNNTQACNVKTSQMVY